MAISGESPKDGHRDQTMKYNINNNNSATNILLLLLFDE
jgi:hypothetical protein